MKNKRGTGAFRPNLVSLAVASCFAASTALANPTNPTVVHGAANFANPAANVLNVTTATSKTIINWGSFSINANELTKFLQPSAASAVLNRVAAGNPSQILGALQSNGRVFIVNPSGIMFGAGAQVDVAGLIATSLNLSNADFLADRLKFTDGASAGSVVNQGNITTGSGGEVYLVGNAVTNNGIITSPNGTVVLAAGNSVELVNPGTPNLRVEIVAPENEARNLGQIVVDSGRAGIYAGLINNSGTVRADSVVSEGGRILLKATKSVTLEDSSVLSAQGKGGGEIKVLATDNVRVAGKLDASAPNGGDGGFIETSAHSVNVASSTRVSTSAPFGKAGTWLIDPADFYIATDCSLTPIVTCNIDGTTLSTNLGSTPVVITSDDGTFVSGQTNGDIFVFDNVTWGSSNSLTLTARRNVNINASIINSGSGDINLNAGWDGSNPSSTTPPVPNAGDIVISFSSVDTGGNVSFRAGQDIVMNAGRVWAGMGSTLSGDRSLVFNAGRDIKLLNPDGGADVQASTAPGYNATTTFTAGNSITVTGSDVYSIAADNASGSGGSATINFTTTGTGAGSGIFINGGSEVEATGGSSTYASSGANGGNSTIRLVSGSGITIDQGIVIAQAGVGSFGWGVHGDGLVDIRAPGAIDITGDGIGVTVRAFGRNAAVKIAGSGSESLLSTPTNGAGSISITNARVRGDGAEGSVNLHLLANGAIGITNSGEIQAFTSGQGEAQTRITSLGGAVSVTGSTVVAHDEFSIAASQLAISGATGISITSSTVRSENISSGGAMLSFSSGGDITLNSSTVFSEANNNSYAVTGVSAAGSISSTNSSISAHGVNSSARAILGLEAGTDISLTGGSFFATVSSGTTLVGLNAGNNIQIGGAITSTGGIGSSNWFSGFIPAGVAGILPYDSFTGIGLNAGNLIVGGSGTLNAGSFGSYALQAVGGIGTLAAPVRISTSNINGTYATNTGSSGDIALAYSYGCCSSMSLQNGTALFNANPGGTYYIQVDGGEGLNLNTAFMPGGSNPGAGQTVHFKATDTSFINSGIGLTAVETTGSITGAGKVILEGGYFVSLAPGTSISAGDVLLKSNSMDIQGTVTAANNIFVTPFSVQPIQLGTAGYLSGVLALDATELTKFTAPGLGVGTDGVTANTETLRITAPIGPFNAFPNLFGNNILQNSGATINSPGGLNAFSTGSIIMEEAGNNIGSFGGTAGTNINVHNSGNIGLGVVTAGSSASFASGGGLVYNIAGPAGLITAPTIVLAGATGVGQVGAPIFVSGVTSLSATNSGAGDISISYPAGNFTVGTGGWALSNAGGGYIIGGNTVTLNSGAPSSGPMFIGANDVIVAPSGYTNSGIAVLTAINNVSVNGNVTATDVALFGGNQVNINGATVNGTNSASVLATKLNITAGSTPAQLKAGTVLGVAAGDITLQGGSGPGAFAEMSVGPAGTMDVFTVASSASSGNINLKGGSGSGAYARIFGDPDVGTLLLPVSVGGVINMDAGAGTGAYARIESASVNSIHIDFTDPINGGFFVNGVKDAVSSGQSGFFAGGQPAVPGQNFFATFGTGTTVPAELPPAVQGGIEQAINQVVASTNDTTTLTQENAISGDSEANNSGTGGTTEEKQKKALPICGK